MYTVTDIEIINGEKTTLIPADGLEFNSISEIDEYQAKLSERYGKTVYVNYKVPISEYVKILTKEPKKGK